MRLTWTDRASKHLEYIFTCAQDYYSRSLLKKLSNELKQIERIIEDSPLIGSEVETLTSSQFKYRKVVLCKPFVLVYFIWEDAIFIADIWDTRRNPENNQEGL